MRLLLITIRIALRALRRNIMRSLLTTLGIIIGVAAVIAMVSIGQGASVSVQEQIARMGNNMLIILPGTTTQGGIRSGLGGASTLTANDAKAIQRECTAVGAVTYVATECRRELDTYCANVEVGEGRVAQCLKDRASELSPACDQALTTVGVK